GHEGKRRAQAQRAQGVAEVLQEGLDPSRAAHVTALLLDLAQIADDAVGGVAGLGGRHAGGDVLRGLLLQMEAQLGEELRLDPVPAEERAQAQPQKVQSAHSESLLTPSSRSG